MVELLALYRFIAEKFLVLDPARGTLSHHPIPYDDASILPAEKEFFEALSQSNYTYFAKDPKTKHDDKTKRALTDHFLTHVLSMDKCKTVVLAYLLSKQNPAPAPPAAAPGDPEELQKLNKVISTYEKQVADLQASVKTWQERTLGFSHENSELRGKLVEKGRAEITPKEVDALRRDLKEKRADYNELEANYRQKMQENNVLKKNVEKLEAKEFNKAHENDDYQRLKKENFEKSTQIQKLNLQVSQLQTQVKTDYQQIAEEESEELDDDGEKIDYKKECEAKDKRIEDLKKQMKELRGKLNAGNPDTLSAPSGQNAPVIKALQKQVKDLKAKLSAPQTTSQDYQKKIEEIAVLTAQVAGLKAQLAAKPAAAPDREVVELEKQVAAYEALFNQAQALFGSAPTPLPAKPIAQPAPAAQRTQAPPQPPTPATGQSVLSGKYEFIDNYTKIIRHKPGPGAKELRVLLNGQVTEKVRQMKKICTGTYTPPGTYDISIRNALDGLEAFGLITRTDTTAQLTPDGKEAIEALLSNRPDLFRKGNHSKASPAATIAPPQPAPQPTPAQQEIEYQLDPDLTRIVKLVDGQKEADFRFIRAGKPTDKVLMLHQMHAGTYALPSTYDTYRLTLQKGLKDFGLIRPSSTECIITPEGKRLIETLEKERPEWFTPENLSLLDQKSAVPDQPPTKYCLDPDCSQVTLTFSTGKGTYDKTFNLIQDDKACPTANYLYLVHQGCPLKGVAFTSVQKLKDFGLITSTRKDMELTPMGKDVMQALLDKKAYAFESLPKPAQDEPVAQNGT